ncbi:MAG: SET domain-containing protein-lysine N-methyltransferase [Ferruginibacter sp.]
MKKLLIKEIKGKGRGVFCTQLIKKEEIIEVCALLAFPVEDTEILLTSQLADYFFNFNKDDNTLCLALGFGSLYNHAMYSNAAYHVNSESSAIHFYAIQDIFPLTEICINYGGEHGREFNEWFEARNIPISSE